MFNNNNTSGTRSSFRSPGQYSGNNDSQRGIRNTSYCQYCHIPGHDTKDCRKLARFLKENNITISMNSPQNPMVNTTSARPTASTPPWMFDSGASHHLRNNLISVAKLCKSNQVSVEFFPYSFLVKDLRTGAPLMRGVNINDIYYAARCSLHQLPRINFTTTSNTSVLSWHHKLGHPSIKVFKFLIRHLGMHCNKLSATSFHCNACSINKSHKFPFGSNSFKASKPLELVYSDVWGPVQSSNDGYTYYVTFVDYYSRYIWLYPMKRKSDVSICHTPKPVTRRKRLGVG
ncbi:hypothetical protein LXL04_027167 [Taraxacum kok-saghyz]